MENNHILILGGSGFLSGTVARLAMQRGMQVWALTRGKRRLPAGVRGLVCDRHDQGEFRRVVQKAGVHWGLVVDCIAYDAGDIEQDVAELRALCDHLVFISTDFVYGPQGRTFPQGENHAIFTTLGYGGKKRAAELALISAQTDPMGWTILRPGHIYGPGSLLGCLPAHGRDAQLIQRLRGGEALRLVGGGYFLQQPVYAPDLAETILSVVTSPSANRQVMNVAGPSFVQSLEYYRIIARALRVELAVEELPVDEYLGQHPEAAPYLCHRIYDLTKLHAAGLAVPTTPLEVGLQAQVDSLMGEAT